MLRQGSLGTESLLSKIQLLLYIRPTLLGDLTSCLLLVGLYIPFPDREYFLTFYHKKYLSVSSPPPDPLKEGQKYPFYI